jgi:XTP/dITP diphosphohydrolase
MAIKGDGLLRLAEVMDQLRSPGGCAWDAKQTHESLVQYLVEETFETVDAIDSGDRDHLLEELGDLLLQVFFHSRIAEEYEQGAFNIDDVAHGISDKLVRRHPHVFPDENGNVTDAADAAMVEAQWQTLKNAEKSRVSVTDGVPMSLPAFTQINKLLQRSENGGLTAPINTEAAAIAKTIVESEVPIGDVVIALVHEMRQQKIDADLHLRESVKSLRQSIVNAEVSKD